MKHEVSVCLAAFCVIILLAHHSNATLRERLLQRRQSAASGESEQEATTARSQGQQPQQGTGGSGQNPARLYPDLPRQPGAFAPNQNEFQAHPFAPSYHGPPTPFVPFGMQMPAANMQGFTDPRFQPRPMSDSARLQSQTFVNGLGRRLLAMVGIDVSPNGESNSTDTEANSVERQPKSGAHETMRALQNSTILQQLNGGLQTIYGGLSKMYNSTVQQQLNLLQDRFKREAENSTNPWQQKMAQQVPMFFKNMALRVEEAQNNLNRIWQQMTKARNGTLELTGGDPSPRGPFDQFLNNPFAAGAQPNNFFGQMGQSFGFDPDKQGPVNSQQGHDVGAQFMGFWHNQVMPQIAMVRGQVARVWRDLTASGAMMPNQMIRRTNNGNSLGASAPENSSSPDIVDSILSELNMDSAEFISVESKQGGNGSEEVKQQSMLSPSMQNGVIAAQRELNQLWNGLTNSLQGAIANVRSTLNPRPQFNSLNTMASNENKQEVDPAENEIDGKLKDLTKLQRDADAVLSVVQRQQQQQQQQQRPNFGDRFRNFFNGIEFGNIDQIPNRFGESVSRFGNAVGDFWQQIPGRWDNFMQNMRPQDSGRVRQSSTSTTEKPASASTERA